MYRPLSLNFETNLTCIFKELADLDLASVVWYLLLLLSVPADDLPPRACWDSALILNNKGS